MTLLTYAINGVPIEQYGLVQVQAAGWVAAPKVSYQPSSPLHTFGRPGNRASAYGQTWSNRALILGFETSAGATLTPTQARALLGPFYAAMNGRLEIEMADAPGIVTYGYFESSGTDSTPSPSLAFLPGGTILQIAGTIVGDDPYWYDRAPQLTSAAATVPLALPVGTAGGCYEYAIVGAATNPTLAWYTRGGTLIDQMRLTVTLGSGDVFSIKPDQTTKEFGVLTAGVLTPQWSALNPADTIVHPDPEDGPYLTVSAGTLLVRSWRAYLV